MQTHYSCGTANITTSYTQLVSLHVMLFLVAMTTCNRILCFLFFFPGGGWGDKGSKMVRYKTATGIKMINKEVVNVDVWWKLFFTDCMKVFTFV